MQLTAPATFCRERYLTLLLLLPTLSGPKREAKKALEAYWAAGAANGPQLLAAAADIEAAAWRRQAEAGVELTGLDGTLYDQMLDAVFQLGLLPPRFQVACFKRWVFERWEGPRLEIDSSAPPTRGCAARIARLATHRHLTTFPCSIALQALKASAEPSPADGPYAGGGGLDLYFKLARGAEGAPALDMSKYMDTNYHIIVPELCHDTGEPRGPLLPLALPPALLLLLLGLLVGRAHGTVPVVLLGELAGRACADRLAGHARQVLQ